ncbi:class I SAM-dependent methyltransferase [Mucilaginibacter aquaedulcis]|uniref:class I SAM-dependent methyltransferase n=1 Tax=Mucilaginibacter aquaedulcis TaxID=1187081 RepID=UPI0025B4BE2D|nr:class I SAM-dependent methyltransferase [Mucilaginibacter aquaedulcis]MDN3548370.1 class I SAM-dependent methyltransferase [Mucilaginibacter aquaedulcis]
MKQIDAMALIKNGIDVDRQQHWADLGCGNGTFTEALFHLLPKGSSIEAVDQEIQHLGIPVNFIQANFETDNLVLPPLDGILMANSLHYIKDKKKLIHKLESYFVNDRNFLIVEYDTDVANPWVPYPFSFQSITTLFTELGYNRINKLGSQSSIYKRAEIYAALIQS